jgi:PRC-barrel domain.
MHTHRLTSAMAGLALALTPFSAALAADQTDIRLFPRGAQQIIGQPVTGSNDQKVGEVRDVIIGADGQVEGVLLERGGIAGVGAKQAAIDWSQFSVNPQGGLRIDMDENQVSQLPEYEEGSRALIESTPQQRQ